MGRRCSLYGTKITPKRISRFVWYKSQISVLWRHRFLMAQAGKNNDVLSGIIEVDEFFLAHSEKGSKTLAYKKKARKHGGNLDKELKRDK